MAGEHEQAQALAKFLLDKQTYGYGQDRQILSPLDVAIRGRIEDMVREISQEVVDAVPDLRETVRGYARQTLEQVLRDDAFLRDTVVKSVAKAIRHGMESGDED